MDEVGVGERQQDTMLGPNVLRRTPLYARARDGFVFGHENFPAV
jgi:hypothetical protein